MADAATPRRRGTQAKGKTGAGDAKPAAARRLGKKDLAQTLGISRPTLDGYLNRADPPPPVPDGDRLYDLNEVAAYIAANAANPTSTEAIRRLRENLLKTQAEDAAMDLAVKRGRLIDRAAIEPGVAEIQAWWSSKLQAVFEGELPRKYEGKSTIDRQKLNADAIDRLMREFKERMATLARGGRAA